MNVDAIHVKYAVHPVKPVKVLVSTPHPRQKHDDPHDGVLSRTGTAPALTRARHLGLNPRRGYAWPCNAVYIRKKSDVH